MGGWAYLASLAPLAIVCVLVYSLIALTLLHAAGPRGVRAYLAASLPVIAVLVVGVVGFEVVAHRARGVAGPGGVGERQGGDLRLYWLVARLAFYLLYAGALLWIVVWGYSIGNRLAGRGVLVSVASTAALLGLMGVTLPFVDFVNTCLIGIPFVLSGTTC